MLSPRRRVITSAAAVVVGVGCLVVAFLLPDDPERVAVPIVVGCAGLLGVVFGGLGFKWSLAAYSAERALRKHHELIGHWRVDPATWREFVSLNQTFSANQIVVPATIPDEGIDVKVSATALLVGNQIELLNRTGLVDGAVRHWGGDWTVTQASVGGEQPCCLYLYARMRSPQGRDTSNNMIVPVPVDAIPVARRVCEHFQADIAKFRDE